MSINQLWFDESGDCGFKFERGSSKFLVIVAVYILDRKEDVVNNIEAVKARHNFNLQFEFKFSRCKDALKDECLHAIARCQVAYKAIVVDKKNLKVPALIFHSRELYFEAIRRLLYDNDPALAHATLTVDEATAKIHYREWGGMLKRYVSGNTVQKVQQVRSKSDTMIQIADMLAGSIARLYEKGDDRWYQIINIKEKILMKF